MMTRGIDYLYRVDRLNKLEREDLNEARMTYRTEFPDYDPTTLPAIPADWKDISWHNDLSPSWDTGRKIYRARRLRRRESARDPGWAALLRHQQ